MRSPRNPTPFSRTIAGETWEVGRLLQRDNASLHSPHVALPKIVNEHAANSDTRLEGERADHRDWAHETKGTEVKRRWLLESKDFELFELGTSVDTQAKQTSLRPVYPGLRPRCPALFPVQNCWCHLGRFL